MVMDGIPCSTLKIAWVTLALAMNGIGTYTSINSVCRRMTSLFKMNMRISATLQRSANKQEKAEEIIAEIEAGCRQRKAGGCRQVVAEDFDRGKV